MTVDMNQLGSEERTLTSMKNMCRAENYSCNINQQRLHKTVRVLDDKYQVDNSKVLGHGACGIVRRAWPRSGNVGGASMVAIKSVPIKRRQAAYEEVAILRMLDHPNICKLLDVLEDDEYVHFVLEHIEGGDLCDYLLANGPMEERLVGMIAQQVFGALLHCHEDHHVIHGDLKPENIMNCTKGVSGKNSIPTPNVKLIDFGIAARGAGFYALRGTRKYLSPELRVSGYRSPGSDMWAMGVVLYIMLTGRFPSHVSTKGGDTVSVAQSLRPADGARKQRDLLRLPAGAQELVEGLLQTKPSLRPSARVALSHPWVLKCTQPRPQARQISASRTSGQSVRAMRARCFRLLEPAQDGCVQRDACHLFLRSLATVPSPGASIADELTEEALGEMLHHLDPLSTGKINHAALLGLLLEEPSPSTDCEAVSDGCFSAFEAASDCQDSQDTQTGSTRTPTQSEEGSDYK
mmetsp:Transcript_128060/g.362491  ORF Transcript_128060/g.362491 Transcript_128060/m.362491 type:complete len:463 (-) Transcript_128060:91-1479(-)